MSDLQQMNGQTEEIKDDELVCVCILVTFVATEIVGTSCDVNSVGEFECRDVKRHLCHTHWDHSSFAERCGFGPSEQRR